MADGNKIGRLALIWVILILEQYEETLFTRRDGVRPHYNNCLSQGRPSRRPTRGTIFNAGEMV